MNKKGERLTALILVFFLLVIAGNLSAAIRVGVRLVIQKTDGQEVAGELVTVKSDSLLILNKETEEDTTVNLSDIDVITVDNKSKMFEFGVGGFLLAGAARISLHSAVEKKNIEDEATAHQVQSVWFIGAAGAGVGILAGALMGINKNIQIQGKSEEDIQTAMEKLSKKARVRGIQQ
ncbi:MAG: hypothetical protein MUP98_14515 [Candidatus Aminicenantes bacterium]|nr:hypothetical protein [Candidatus Aminicenantes bacterium]